MSTSFPGAYREVTDTKIFRPPAANPASLANNARPTAVGLLGGSPGSRPAFRRSVPQGKKNFTAAANPRQIKGPRLTAQ